MLVFPQLVTGAAALYPVTRQRVARTVVNKLGDGSRVIYSDSDAAATEWEMRTTGLTAAEWNAIEAVFEAASGQLQTITFLDPAGNLLAQSENFGASAWTNGALIQLTTGSADPLGGTGATQVVNAGQTAQAVAQTLGVPGNFEYYLSVWAQTAGASSATLTASTSGASQSLTFPLTTKWQRLGLFVSLDQNTTSVTFGVQLNAGASVGLFGMQVDAQPAPSSYRKTGATGGVYATARFAADQITFTAQGTDVYDAVIRIVTNGY
jgi:hypothetical protein